MEYFAVYKAGHHDGMIVQISIQLDQQVKYSAKRRIIAESR
jgi:hypothetical protein